MGGRKKLGRGLYGSGGGHVVIGVSLAGSNRCSTAPPHTVTVGSARVLAPSKNQLLTETVVYSDCYRFGWCVLHHEPDHPGLMA